eukprot:NODE_1639_length_1106_cov_76.997162_g1339_i0.p2 GENE.NODE_1639_length_1106_cov_76.997162_g1339_i0~~NODE_1639_length_1106_cov_76.997162_g1339_i0.p2  ORF type:complete len:62 (+),score=8.72 NODE_1639_length_1106_cov_76.997162_g1339_i0:346-531(+)
MDPTEAHQHLKSNFFSTIDFGWLRASFDLGVDRPVLSTPRSTPKRPQIFDQKGSNSLPINT